MSRSLRCNIACALALLSSSVMAAPQSLTVISFGGATKQAQDKAYFQPFNASGAGSIVAGEYNGELSKIKAMVAAGHTSWDVVEVESPELLRGCEEGLFEKLDLAGLGDPANYVPGALNECGVATYVWSMVLAYDQSKLAKAPSPGRTSGTLPCTRASAGCAKGPSTPWRSPCWPMGSSRRTCTRC